MIKDLSYVSVAVNNIDDAISNFEHIYGIKQVTPISYNRGYGWLRVILGNGPEAFLELLQPTDEKLPLARFLAKKGESVYLFSFTVDDIAATARHLLHRKVRFATGPEGARPERVRSIWIHPRATTGVYIELTQSLLENEYLGFGDSGATPDAILSELSYVAAVVQDIDASTRFYQDILGLDIISPRNTEPTLNFERVVLGAGERGLFELMQPNNSESAMGRYLTDKGQGPYMACFLTDDAATAADRINAKGGTATPDEQYGAWVHPKTNSGLFIELSERYLTPSHD